MSDINNQNSSAASGCSVATDNKDLVAEIQKLHRTILDMDVANSYEIKAGSLRGLERLEKVALSATTPPKPVRSVDPVLSVATREDCHTEVTIGQYVITFNGEFHLERSA